MRDSNCILLLLGIGLILVLIILAVPTAGSSATTSEKINQEDSPYQLKLFGNPCSEKFKKADKVEQEFNDWMKEKEGKIEIVSVSTSAADLGVFYIVVVYKEKK